MSLTQHAPTRRCGKRFGTEDEALHSKLALAGSHAVVPCLYGCGGWHLERAAEPAKPARKAPKDTGPTRKVRATVLERDGYACVDCGQSVIGRRYALQHRDARGMGGTSDPRSSTPVNLLTMLEEHHLRVESRIDPEDNAKGYWLRMGQDPALEPVMYFSPHGSGFTAWLSDSGDLIFEAPAGGAA